MQEKTTSEPTSDLKVMYSCVNGYNLVSGWDVLWDMQRRLSDLSLIDQTSVQYVERPYNPFMKTKYYPWQAYVPIWGCSHTRTKTTLTMQFAIINMYIDERKEQVYSHHLDQEEDHYSFYSALNHAVRNIGGNSSLEIVPSSDIPEYWENVSSLRKYAFLEQYNNGKQRFSAPLGTLKQTQPLFEMMEDMINRVDGNLNNILRPGYVGWFSVGS